MSEEQNFLVPDLDALRAEQSEAAPASGATQVGSVLAANHDALMSRTGVVMVGETIDGLGRPAILIGVKTADQLASLPSEVDGVPVVTQVIGEVDAL